MIYVACLNVLALNTSVSYNVLKAWCVLVVNFRCILLLNMYIFNFSKIRTLFQLYESFEYVSLYIYLFYTSMVSKIQRFQIYTFEWKKTFSQIFDTTSGLYTEMIMYMLTSWILGFLNMAVFKIKSR